jgi:hypothetical protein
MALHSKPAQGWYVGDWTGWGWAETGVKAVAIGVGLIALANALPSPAAEAVAGARLIQVIVLGILALLLTFGIFDRLMEREIIAMIFILFNVVAHWGMTFALTRTPGPGALLLIYAIFMLAGDLVKLRFLAATNFTVRTFNTRALMILTGVFVVGYAVVLLLALTDG